MNIVILSGGSGNDALVRGLKYFYPGAKIDIIINQYDSGKSTGICRKVTNTLGVSDARKNHIRLYKAVTDPINIDERIIEFYENRYDFTKGNEVTEILERLSKWGLTCFNYYVRMFFKNPNANSYEYTNFNIANIVYAQMYKELGLDYTHKYFCNLLGIENCVHVNSYDNVWLKARTDSGHIIEDEGDIVEWCNSEDKIKDVIFVSDKELEMVTEKSIELLDNADLIIISTGTFWSSILPTLKYGALYYYINKSKAKKIWAINNEEDKDSYGVSSNDFINIVENTGLDLNDFIILENYDAKKSLQENNDKYHIERFHMLNHNGKHDSDLFVYAILACYFGLNRHYDKIIFDFDDTLYSRSSSEYNKRNISALRYLSDNRDVYIISGNSYKSIFDKMTPIFGNDLKNCPITIIADANTHIYKNGDKLQSIDSMIIDDTASQSLIDTLKAKFNLNPYDVCDSCIKYKPLDDLTRDLLVEYINSYLKIKGIIAKKTGTTTVDIVSEHNDKSNVFDKLDFENYSTLYIGDETDSGNDYSIARKCDTYIHVKDVEETNAIIELIMSMGDKF